MKIDGPVTCNRGQSAPTKTTVMELVETLSCLTKDDALVVAAVKNIFAFYQVRLCRTLAPMRLVHGEISAKAGRRLPGKRGSAWA